MADMHKLVIALTVDDAAARQALREAQKAVEALLPGSIYRAWSERVFDDIAVSTVEPFDVAVNSREDAEAAERLAEQLEADPDA